MQTYDFYHLPLYHALAEIANEGTAELLVFHEGEYFVALPLMMRLIPKASGVFESTPDLMDATSVYGYAGPLSSDWNLPPEVVARFQAELRDQLQERGIISVFSRLHPLFAQDRLLVGLGQLKDEGPTVSIDLSESQWSQIEQYSSNHKRGIKRLHSVGVKCFLDDDLRYLDDFIDAYYENMDRVHASRHYYFPRSYFHSICEGLRDRARLFVCRLHEETVCAGLFMICGDIIQYHLGGTKDKIREVVPKQATDGHCS